MKCTNYKLESIVLLQCSSEYILGVDDTRQPLHLQPYFDENRLQPLLVLLLPHHEVHILILTPFDIRVSVVEVERYLLFDQDQVPVFVAAALFVTLVTHVLEFEFEGGRVAHLVEGAVPEVQWVCAEVDAEFVLLLHLSIFAWEVKYHALVVSVREWGVACEFLSIFLQVDEYDRVVLVVIVFLAVGVFENWFFDVEVIDKVTFFHDFHS